MFQKWSCTENVRYLNFKKNILSKKKLKTIYIILQQ